MARMGWRGCEDGVGESVGRRERWNAKVTLNREKLFSRQEEVQ